MSGASGRLLSPPTSTAGLLRRLRLGRRGAAGVGRTKVVYVNDARNNNHGSLLLHVHVDLLPPAVATAAHSPPR